MSEQKRWSVGAVHQMPDVKRAELVEAARDFLDALLAELPEGEGLRSLAELGQVQLRIYVEMPAGKASVAAMKGGEPLAAWVFWPAESASSSQALN